MATPGRMIAAILIAACLASPAFAGVAAAGREWFPGLSGPSSSVSGEYEACRSLVAAGRFEQAEPVATELIERDRRHPGAWHILGTCRWMAGDRLGAREAWKLSLELEDDPGLRAFLERADDAEGGPPPAQPFVSPELEFRAAVELFSAGLREEALARAVASVKMRPSRWAAWVLVGDIKDRVLDRDGAEEAWRKAVSLRPGDKALGRAIAKRRAGESWCRACERADALESEVSLPKASAPPKEVVAKKPAPALPLKPTPKPAVAKQPPPPPAVATPPKPAVVPAPPSAAVAPKAAGATQPPPPPAVATPPKPAVAPAPPPAAVTAPTPAPASKPAPATPAEPPPPPDF